MYSYVTSSCNLVATFRGIVSHFVQTGYVFFVPIQLMTLNIAHEYVKIIINLCTGQPHYNAIFGVHENRPCYK